MTPDISCLCQVSRSAYAIVQIHLYGHVQLDSFDTLTLLTRTLTQNGARVKAQLSTLTVTLDRRGHAARGSQIPPPVLIAGMVSMIARYELSFSWYVSLMS